MKLHNLKKNSHRFCKIPSNNVDVLIVDAVGSEWMKYSIPSDFSVSILNIRGVIPYIGKISFFMYILRRFLGLGITLKALIAAFVDEINPKVIITFIDNVNVIGGLHNTFENKLVISIQNSIKYDSIASTGGWTHQHELPYYFGFGDHEYHLMRKKNVSVKKYYAVGSLKMGIFLSRNYKLKDVSSHAAICFVSQYRYTMVNSDNASYRQFVQMSKNLYLNVISWAKNTGCNVIVALASEKGDVHHLNEVSFLKDSINYDKVNLIPNNKEDLLAYKLAFNSSVIVTMDSTLGFESFGYGKKVLFCSTMNSNFSKLRGLEENFKKMPEIVLLDAEDKGTFFSKMDRLYSIDQSEYADITKDARSYYMKCETIYPHEEIKRHISDFIREQ